MAKIRRKGRRVPRLALVDLGEIKRLSAFAEYLTELEGTWGRLVEEDRGIRADLRSLLAALSETVRFLAIDRAKSVEQQEFQEKILQEQVRELSALSREVQSLKREAARLSEVSVRRKPQRRPGQAELSATPAGTVAGPDGEELPYPAGLLANGGELPIVPDLAEPTAAEQRGPKEEGAGNE